MIKCFVVYAQDGTPGHMYQMNINSEAFNRITDARKWAYVPDMQCFSRLLPLTDYLGWKNGGTAPMQPE
jgi:hypothetical protein